jgi:ubiquinone/menaquinone biosynthesis C-methylase UbiE
MRYVFASKFVKGKSVLDAGCGIGYGSNFIAKAGAKKVIGIDISKDAIKVAKQRYENEQIQFMIMDITQLEFPENSFDVICCFEVIEHIKNYHKALSELKRVLKNGGLCIISTPNKEISSPRRKEPINPFHVKEFSPAEFYGLLKKYFDDISLYGQSFSLISRIFSLIPYGVQLKQIFSVKIVQRHPTLELRRHAKCEVRKLEKHHFLIPYYIVALCK